MRSTSLDAWAEMPQPLQMQDRAAPAVVVSTLLPGFVSLWPKGIVSSGWSHIISATRLARFDDRPTGKPKPPGDRFCQCPSRSDRAPGVDIHADLEVVGVSVTPEHAELLDVRLSVERV